MTKIRKLKAIEEAIKVYHTALNNREHGGVAQDNCIKSIENILGIYLGNWSTPQQKELKKED